MLNVLAAEAVGQQKHKWSSSFCYVFREGEAVHWGGWIAETGHVLALSLLQAE